MTQPPVPGPDRPRFRVEVYQNRYLPAGGGTVDAIVTVTASQAVPGATAPPTAAEVIMIDCSKSMGYPAARMFQAQRATAAALDTLRDGVAFAVIAGRHDARMVYPDRPGLAVASPGTRERAKAAVDRLVPGGGTAIGAWLHLANQVFSLGTAESRHAIVLTDGRNEHEPPGRLAEILSACEGRFVCDVRGVGDDWAAGELRMIASALLGTADGLADPAQLPEAFRVMTEAAMARSAAWVTLRVWTPAGGGVRVLKQTYPQVMDLTGRRREIAPRTGEYPTGAWGADSRDYHLSVQVPPGATGEEILAARVSVASGGQVAAQGLVLATWTGDAALSTGVNPRVAHYDRQVELVEAIQEGLAAREGGDVDTATVKLGRAVQLAAGSGHNDTTALLRRVVEVLDAGTGTVALRRNVAGVDAQLADVRSVNTIRDRDDQGGDRGADLPEGPPVGDR